MESGTWNWEEYGILFMDKLLKPRIPCCIFIATLLALYLALLEPMIAAPAGSGAKLVEFGRDIRPIFSDNCFACHGPDEKTRQVDLRLDTREGPFEDRGGYRIIAPGDSSRSRLFQRINSEDEALLMPPSWSGRELTRKQIELIRQWIDQGAEWRLHWSFIPPKRPPLPKVKNGSWPRNPIDHFILSRLEREGLQPSPEAVKETLMRRVTLDLTGLPPTPAEVDAFLADGSPDAYEKVVDRLLQSPHYGERMAMQWLDLARYADTHGYQTDGDRDMWRWRDWVIEAFNRNLSFDQFTIEQLGGDLLPEASLDQKIATGFHRNHRSNSEGGVVPEEWLVEYAVDRVNTTATVWLGLTLGCARCHDHKYDPIAQKEFYQVFAFFNNVPERGIVYKIGNSEPFIKAPTPCMQRELDDLERELASAQGALNNVRHELAAAQVAWEAAPAAVPIDWTISDGLVARFGLDGDTTDKKADRSGSWISAPADSKAVESDAEAGIYGPGKIGRAAGFDGHRFVDVGKVAPFGAKDKVSFGAWIYPSDAQAGGIFSIMEEDFRPQLFSLHLSDSKIRVNLGQRWLDDSIRLETEMSLTPKRWYHVMITHDGSQRAKGLKIYVDGELQEVRILLDGFTGELPNVKKNPLRIGVGDEEKYFKGSIDDVRYYDRELSAPEIEAVASAESVAEILAIPRAERTRQQSQKIDAYFVENEAPPHIRRSYQHLKKVSKRKEQLEESIPTVMVMQEAEKPRPTFVLRRGEYDKPTDEKVSRGVPGIFPPLPEGAPDNRLGLAQWLVDPSNPLTSRVTVNRFWEMYFGTGLVKTTEDFGSQGELPSHQDLLDWLATEFVGSGWDIKAMQKRIVMSATYRQSSKVSEHLLQKDPDNRLLARAPRLRLPAEMVRDQALAASGLLKGTIGGPSVKPYQPPGLWEELSERTYVQDHGDQLYRRSMYTFWKRTVPPPTMTTFDAGAREMCIVRRERTNTPLQALALMNDVTYVEAARVLAEHMMSEGGATPEERVTLGFRLLTARRPTSQEKELLLNGFHRNRDRYQENKEAAMKLVSTGEFERNEQLDVSELAAYTMAASLILNLDEVITKE